MYLSFQNCVRSTSLAGGHALVRVEMVDGVGASEGVDEARLVAASDAPALAAPPSEPARAALAL